MLYTVITDDIFLLDTAEDYAEAKAALREAGLNSTPIFSGGPDEPDSVQTSCVLFA